MGRSFWRPRRGHRPLGQAPSPRDRHPDRGLELSPPPARRSPARAHSSKGSDPAPAARATTQAPRPATQKRRCRSRQWLITTPAKLGNFERPKVGRFRGPLTPPSRWLRGPGVSPRTDEDAVKGGSQFYDRGLVSGNTRKTDACFGDGAFSLGAFDNVPRTRDPNLKMGR